jgi:hypothetical protein
MFIAVERLEDVHSFRSATISTGPRYKHRTPDGVLLSLLKDPSQPANLFDRRSEVTESRRADRPG